jgi:hypothetical protein
VNVYKILVGKLGRKRPLGRPGRIIFKCILNIECEGVNWIQLAQGTVF